MPGNTQIRDANVCDEEECNTLLTMSSRGATTATTTSSRHSSTEKQPSSWRKRCIMLGMLVFILGAFTYLFEKSIEEQVIRLAGGTEELRRQQLQREDDDYDEAVKSAREEERSYFVNEQDILEVFSKQNQLMNPFQECHPNNTGNYVPGTFEYERLAADCGLGYNFTNSTARKRPWKVALWGFNRASITLSGCPVGSGGCPFSPRCQIYTMERREEANTANVVVIFQHDADLVRNLEKHREQYRVLYWREAYMKSASLAIQKLFHFEMGSHWTSGLLNPGFMRTPSALLGGITYPQPQVIPFIRVEKRRNFAMSIISACGANSKRQIYIDRLLHYLGPKRIHQYGRCGDLELPPPPIKNAARIIATYKFFLAFENTIEDGYVTEKLLQVLAMPIIPVYYGTPHTPNITLVPSFIRVTDFGHPKYLADYLLHLEKTPEEYNQYHAWRTNPKLLHPDYLRILKMKNPGPREVLPLRRRNPLYYPRTAACCRLCDENYLKFATEERSHFVEEKWSPSRIEKTFFQGKFFGIPRPLKDPVVRGPLRSRIDPFEYNLSSLVTPEP